VGVGHGRDLRYAQSVLGLEAIGIDNCVRFIELLRKKEQESWIRPGSVLEADMRDLSCFDSQSFDAVRQNASLLHVPIVKPGIMADKALEESFRVLKPEGVLFVSVKAGDGVAVVDTKEGLGARFYQMYSRDLLKEMLSRNRFHIFEIAEDVEMRGEQAIEWFVAFAGK
jgi:ubiquinone/menaquinone biosynthesis C-methylase UbiE